MYDLIVPVETVVFISKVSPNHKSEIINQKYEK